MDIQAIWLIVLAVSVSVSVGGVVGFFFQLRQLKQAKLKNDMLELEIADLKKRIKDAEQVIVRATLEEVKAYGQKISEPHVMYSRGFPRRESTEKNSHVERLRASLVPLMLLGLALAFFGYLLFDIYRVGRWMFAN